MFYEPIQTSRHFSKDQLYSDIDWSDFAAVVLAFEERIKNWYFAPAKILSCDSGHHAFSIMAIDCLLIDTFSQFVYGQLESSRDTFIKFVNNQLPNFSATLSYPIVHYSHTRNEKQLTTIAEVLYYGFRCGILHQSHIPLYGRIDPGGSHFVEDASGYAIYSNKKIACPTIAINPLRLLEDLDLFFQDYISKLKSNDPHNEPLRDEFKKKFTDIFGINI